MPSRQSSFASDTEAEMSDERRAEIEAVAEALLPWRCYNGHIVPGWAMPQSGTKCNVAGCDRPGRYRSTDPLHRLDAQSAAEKVIDVLDRVRDARGDGEAPRTVGDVIRMADEIKRGYPAARSPQGEDHEPPVLLQDHGPGHRYADGTICPYCAQGEDHEAGIEEAYDAADACFPSSAQGRWLRLAVEAAIGAYLARVSAPKADEKQEGP